VRLSVDFDEEVLQLVAIEPVLERPDGEPWRREDAHIVNDNAVPGSAGVDEGYFTGRYQYASWPSLSDPLAPLCLPVEEEFVFLDFRFQIQPDAPPQVTEVRFLDGGDYCSPRSGTCWPLRNSLLAGQAPLPPEFVNSFIFVNGRINIVPDVTVFIRGDSNGDDTVDLSDAQTTLGYLFLGHERPYCFDAADANDDGQINIADPVATLQHLFLGGEELPPPTGEPGEDPTEDGMTCATNGV
jgi:hypothetical protein